MVENKDSVLEQKLEKIKKKQAKLQAAVRLAKSRQAEIIRRLETRRKIIVGGALLASENPSDKETAARLIAALTRAADREAFGLLPDQPLPVQLDQPQPDQPQPVQLDQPQPVQPDQPWRPGS